MHGAFSEREAASWPGLGTGMEMGGRYRILEDFANEGLNEGLRLTLPGRAEITGRKWKRGRGQKERVRKGLCQVTEASRGEAFRRLLPVTLFERKGPYGVACDK